MLSLRMGRQPPRPRQQKERKRRSRIVVGRYPIVAPRRRTISGGVDLILLHVLSMRGGIGWIRESSRDNESGGKQRSDGKSEHDWLPLKRPRARCYRMRR